MAGESEKIDQDDIERLLNQAKQPSKPAPPAASAKPTADPSSLQQDDIEALLNPGKATAGAKKPLKQDDENRVLEQGDIEALLQAKAPQPKQRTAPQGAGSVSDEAVSEIAEEDVEMLLQQAERALASIDAPSQSAFSQGLAAFQLREFTGAPPSETSATLDLIRDVELDLKIELGRTHMHLEEVLKLRKGAVVPLDKMAGDPVDIYVNGRLIARGEVLVLNDNFCVRVAELIAGEPARAC